VKHRHGGKALFVEIADLADPADLHGLILLMKSVWIRAIR